jgi:hypothetical protein
VKWEKDREKLVKWGKDREKLVKWEKDREKLVKWEKDTGELVPTDFVVLKYVYLIRFPSLVATWLSHFVSEASRTNSVVGTTVASA